MTIRCFDAGAYCLRANDTVRVGPPPPNGGLTAVWLASPGETQHLGTVVRRVDTFGGAHYEVRLHCTGCRDARK